RPTCSARRSSGASACSSCCACWSTCSPMSSPGCCRDRIGRTRRASPTTRSTRNPPMKVALFVTCFNDTMFPESAKATVELLERLGVDVDFPAGQTCCGQMHITTGYRAEALPLVRRYVETFEGYDAVVAPSA